jgi:hypothetical protein
MSLYGAIARSEATTCPPKLEERRRKQSIYPRAVTWIASAYAKASADTSLRSQ